MKIAILASCAGLVSRGVEIAAYELFAHLDAEVSVLGLGDAEWVTKVQGVKPTFPLYKIYSKPVVDIKLYRLTSFFPFFDENDLSVLSFMIGALVPLKKLDPDVIINLSGPTAGVFCSFYRFYTKTPFINVGQGGSQLMLAKNRPDAYVPLTPEAKRLVKSKMQNLKVALIPNGVNMDLFSPEGDKYSEESLVKMSKSQHPIIEHPIVLSASALEKLKRIDLLIKAVGKLKHGTLLLAGNGALKNELLDLGNKILGRRFLYLGQIPYTKMPTLYRTCDVFSLPSKSEAFGNVLIEAMASGLPIVSEDDENRRWILGEHGGVLTNLSNIDAFAEAIERAYEKGFDERALEHVKPFSWEAVAKQYMDLIHTLVKKRRKCRKYL